MPAPKAIDYHLEVERHWYSVPYGLVGQRCDIRLSAALIEVFHHSRRVASHRRSTEQGRFTTDAEHMPESHRRHLEWTPGRIVAWAERTGPATGELVGAILASRPHPEQGYLIEDRHGLRSTIVTSQLPVGHWHEALGEPTIADAILDRLVHNAYRVELRGESRRRPDTPVEGARDVPLALHPGPTSESTLSDGSGRPRRGRADPGTPSRNATVGGRGRARLPADHREEVSIRG